MSQRMAAGVVRPEGSRSWTKISRDFTIVGNCYPELNGMNLFDVPGISDEAGAQYRCVMATRRPRRFRSFWHGAVWDVTVEPDETTGGVNGYSTNLFEMKASDTLNTSTLVAFANRVSAALEADVSTTRPSRAATSSAAGPRRAPLKLLPPPQ